MARPSKEANALEARITESYRRAMRGRMVSVQALGALLGRVRADVSAGRLLDDAMRDAVEAHAEPLAYGVH